MSGLIDKAKEKMGKSSGDGQPSSVEKTGDNQLNKQIDNATDRAGLGDKYDAKIDKVADEQLNNQIPGGAGKK
ncbi:Hypothetical predicted protein [Lecanosticta acicola]|uniref:Antitoxin n=1 Tax=Lecanosticta acicola TaxID=111012 RepID=A0AAI8YSL7_9PEZI|nr:Hypothetical predicted protein [Lecanosticta acicola]